MRILFSKFTLKLRFIYPKRKDETVKHKAAAMHNSVRWCLAAHTCQCFNVEGIQYSYKILLAAGCECYCEQ